MLKFNGESMKRRKKVAEFPSPICQEAFNHGVEYVRKHLIMVLN